MNDECKAFANKESNRFIVSSKKKSFNFPDMLKDILVLPKNSELAKHLIIRMTLNFLSTQDIKNQLRQQLILTSSNRNSY